MERLNHIAILFDLILEWVGFALIILGSVSIGIYFHDKDQYSTAVKRVGIYHTIWTLIMGLIYVFSPWKLIFQTIYFEWFPNDRPENRDRDEDIDTVTGCIWIVIIIEFIFNSTAFPIQSIRCPDSNCISILPNPYLIEIIMNYIVILGPPILVITFYVAWGIKLIAIITYKRLLNLLRCCPEFKSCAYYACKYFSKSEHKVDVTESYEIV